LSHIFWHRFGRRFLNEPGGMIGVVGVDRLLQQIGHGVYSSLMT
jgi:hypothetical protein